MKKIIFLLIIVGNSIVAQDLYKNHQKYWYLRSKLRNDFMKIGTEQGESIPLTHRGKDANINDPNKTAIGGGDLISELGIYIAVLATEYNLLSHNNQNTDSVKHELYCALNAVNRLDYNAEPMYGSMYPENLNGFLVRDDVPGNFVLKNYKHFNYYNTWSGDAINDVWPIDNYLTESMKVPNTMFTDRGFQSVVGIGQWQTNSVYYGNYEYPAKHNLPASEYGNYAMSQDHLISLMYGLRLVSEYVDWGATDQNQHFNYGDDAYTSIRQEAGVISDRIVKYLKNLDWKILKPNGHYVSSHQGGDVRGYAYAFAQIAGKINQPGTSVNNMGGFPSHVPEVDQAYHNAWTKNFGFMNWQTAAKTPMTTFDLIVQSAQLSAACQCLYNKFGGETITVILTTIEKIWKWLGTIMGWFYNLLITIISYVTPIGYNNTTVQESLANATVLNPNASRLGQRIMYPQDYALLTTLLLDGQMVGNLNFPSLNYYNSVLSRTSDILNIAPCDGPRNFTYGNVTSTGSSTAPSYDVYEWSSSSLVEHPNSLGSDQIDHVPGPDADEWGLQSGEYNGLDYMLYHNLYYLYKQRLEFTDVKTIDFRDRFINFALPTSSGLGSSSNPVIGAFEHIIADGVVNSNADVNFITGKTFGVSYGTNYEIKPGAQVTVEVYDYNCSNNNYLSGNVMRMTNSNADTNSVYGPIAAKENLYYKEYKPEYKKEISENNKNITKQQQQLMNKKIVNLNEQLAVYPNPNNGNFIIKLDTQKDNDKYTMTIYDMTGKAVLMFENLNTIDKEISIKNTNLSEGSYLVRVIENTSGKQYSEKIIIK